MKLATVLLAAALSLPASLALAQGAAAPADIKAMATSAEVQALIAKAKAMPARPLISQPIVGTGAARANPASIHDNEHELFYVIQGSGTMTSGGTLVNGKRTNPANQSGDSIANGTNTHLAQGDFLIIPAGVAHQITADSGQAIALMTFHAAATAP
jgi:mannose-6-phosphate isomerase-like protein (cupin superfamily)